MQPTLEDAALLFSKWADERTTVRFEARLAAGFFAFDCRVVGCAKGVVGLEVSGIGNVCDLPLAECTFEYAEPRTLAEAMAGGQVFNSGLVATRPTGERLIFLEIRA